MYRVDGPLGPVETGVLKQRALTKPGMPGDPFWCPNKALYPYLYLYLETTQPLRRETGLAHKFTPQPAFSLPKLFARRRPASSSLSSISSRPTVVSLTHPASNCLQLTGAKRTKQRLSRQINIPSTYVDIQRSWHPPKPSRPATPSQNWIIIQRQRRQQN